MLNKEEKKFIIGGAAVGAVLGCLFFIWPFEALRDGGYLMNVYDHWRSPIVEIANSTSQAEPTAPAGAEFVYLKVDGMT